MFTEYRNPTSNTPNGWASMLQYDPLYRFKLALDPRTRVIRKYLSGSILDAGCGRGEWVSFLNTKGYDSVGLDYSSEMIETNKKNFPNCKFIMGDIQSMPLDSDCFNGLISWGVVEHDEAGPDTALKEFHRILKLGGRAMITVPVDSLAQRRASETEFPDGKVFFQYFFTQDELSTLVSNNGFKILETGICSRPHPNLIWPNVYKDAGKFLRRVLQLVAIFKQKQFGNMIYVIAEKQ